MIVREQNTARNGDIVVALLDGEEATVKRFYKERDYIRLQPENNYMEPIYSQNVTILGKVVGLYRRL
ncbi:putative prophage repressor [Thermosinus carboxydivorans Nor1]|uniref:Putative prophage repressor n=1 Tax=Thermosinus carboxydivorans Nor1 TaxID=401526 RepID=A1HMT6_9FIRM|nr:putative prophage repressor [Thermosinus carboxydivorans Nor1]